MCQALKGVTLKNSKTRIVVDHLMNIVKKQAKGGENVTDTQRVQSEEAEVEKQMPSGCQQMSKILVVVI